MNEYEQAAIDFLNQTGTTLDVTFLKNDFHFHNDKHKRDIYKCTLKRGDRYYEFQYGQSLLKSAHYQDLIFSDRKYTLSGSCLSGGYKINDIARDPNIKKVDGIKPSAYDILSCLTKYNPGSFDDFCGEFGYSSDSITAKKVYDSVIDEYLHMCVLFNDNELEKMMEIC